MKNLLIITLALFLLSCNSDSNKKSSKSSTVPNEIRKSNDPVFTSHEEIAEGVTRQIWKEIIFGKYIPGDVKMFTLGKQVSKEGAAHPYQIMSYGYQIKGDKEIFRVSLRSDLKDGELVYQINEEEYFRCQEEDYSPDDFVFVMKTEASKILAEFLQRKIAEQQ